MKALKLKIKQNDLFYSILYFAMALLPLIAKVIPAGSLGPTFQFYFILVWIPLYILTFSYLRGTSNYTHSASGLVLAYILALVNYPQDPLMDFQRQIVHEIRWFMAAAYLSSWLETVVYARYWKKD